MTPKVKHPMTKWILTAVLVLSAYHIQAADTAFRIGQDPTILSQYYNSPNSYPTTKSQTSYVHIDGDLNTSQRSLFATDDVHYEVGTYDFKSEFTGNEILTRLRLYESYGWNIAGLSCYRENWLENRELGGPYPADRRILSQKEITDIRNAFKNANPPLASKNVRLIQLIGGRTWGQNGDSWLRLTDEMKEYLKQFDGVGIECHIGDHDPTSLQDAQETLQAMADMSKWAADNGKVTFVFMGGAPTTYVDIAYTQRTYHYLWAEMIKKGVDYKSDQIIYFRQGARAGNHTPESATNTLTHQVKWLIDSVDNNLPAIRPIANQSVSKNGAIKVPFTLGAELVTSVGEPVITTHSSNPALLPNGNVSLGGGAADRTISLIPAAGQTGSTTITITATIAPFSVSQQFTLTVLEPALTTAAADGPINSVATWGGLLPDSSDRNVWQSGPRSLRMSTGTESFNGDTLVIQSGGQFAPGVPTANLTLNNLVLDGGEIYMGNNAGLVMNLSGKRFLMNSGTLRSGADSSRFIRMGNASLVGNGAIQIAGTSMLGSAVEFLPTIDTRGFSGSFNVTNNGVLNLPPIASEHASFGIALSGSGKYFNDAAVAVTSLTVAGTTYTSGTFGYANFPNEFLNNGGTVMVVANAPPTISAVADQVISEDGSTPELAFTIGDAGVTAGNLVVEAFSSNTTLVPDTNLTLGGSDAARTLIARPAPNQSGTTTIMLRVSDGVLQSTTSFTLTVTAANDAPEIGIVSNQISDGLASTVIHFTVSDHETVADNLTVTRASTNTALLPIANIVLGGSGPSRTANITPVAGVTGKATVTLTVSDGSLSGTRAFTFAVVAGTGPIAAVQTGVITADTTWATGTAPLKGDTRRWQTGAFSITLTGTSYAQFHGDTLQVQAGGRLSGSSFSPTLLMNNLVLDGGQVYMNNNGQFNIDLTGHTFTLNSGSIKSGGDNDLRDITFANGILAGSGTIEILGTSTNGSNVEIEKGTVTHGFTGIFDVKENGILNLPSIASGNASFGIVLSGTGRYWNDASIVVRSLVIGGASFGPGTYTYNSFTTAQQAFLFNNGGTITVAALTPPPAIGLIADQTTFAGSPLEIPFTVSGGADVNALTVTASSANPSLVPNANFAFEGSGANRTLVITPAPGLTGTTEIQLVVSDDNSSATRSFFLTVKAMPRFIEAINLGALSGGSTWSEAAPIFGDSNIWRSGTMTLDMKDGATQTFHGDTLVIQSGGQLIPGIAGAVLSMNNLLLDGGTISNQNNLPFRILLGGKVFTLNGGTLKAGSLNDNRDLRFENGSLSGSGTVVVQNASPTGVASGSDVEFTSTINTGGFTGLFDIKNNGLLNLPPIANATFGIILSGTGKYWNDAAVSLTSLTIAGQSFPPGTYTYANIGTLYQSYLANNSGSITVAAPSAKYAEWAADHQVAGLKTDDDDGDGLPNVVEYALGGDPRNSADRGHGISFSIDSGGMNYTYAKRSALDAGVNYTVQVANTLTSSGWTNSGIVIAVTPLDADFQSITRRIPRELDPSRFIRLMVESR
jgi:hypothetical protein